jgi:mannose-6-phosphate isomerase
LLPRLQAHPDKALAERLHAARPDLYKDDNHKPELACALTPFEAMCGFRAPGEIAAHLRSTPELRAVMGESHAATLEAAADSAAAAAGSSAGGASDAAALEPFKAALKAAFRAIMSQPQETVMLHTTALDRRLSEATAGHRSRASSSAATSRRSSLSGSVDATAAAAAAGGSGSAALSARSAGAGSTGTASAAAAADAPLTADAVALRLSSQFPNDVGIFAPYLLNLLRLAPGEAVFLGANEPHAYLSGDCVEVMACSDNVVRAGLTPKFKDVDTLCSMLTYACGAPTVNRGDALDACTREYRVPVPEFVLQRTELSARASDAPHGYELPPAASAAIIVVVDGEALATVTPPTGGKLFAGATGRSAVDGEAEGISVAQRLEVGQVWLQPARTRVALHAERPLLLFRALANHSGSTGSATTT